MAKLYLTGPDGQETEAISRTHVALGLVAGITDPNTGGLIGDLQDLIKDQIDLEDEELNQILTLIHNTADNLGQQTAGNQFHYYMLSQQYIFDPYTCNLPVGKYQLRTVLDDGTSKYTNIELFQIEIPLLRNCQSLDLTCSNREPVPPQDNQGINNNTNPEGIQPGSDNNGNTTDPGNNGTPSQPPVQPGTVDTPAGGAATGTSENQDTGT